VADLDPVVSQALRKIEAGKKEHDSRLVGYDKAYDIWRATTSTTSRGPDNWQSKLRVKYAMQVIDTALVNIVSGQPRIMVKARRPEFELGAKAMHTSTGTVNLASVPKKLRQDAM